MKKILTVVLAACAMAAILVVPASGATSIKVGDNFFSPKAKTVRKGTVVKWVWAGRRPHNVTVTKGPVKFRSTTKVKGSYSRTMTRRGTYTIVCTIHPGMKMTLKVT